MDAALVLGLVLVAVVGALLVVLAFSLKVLRPYESGVILLFGSYRRTLNPGLHYVSPVYHMIRVDLRVRTVTVPPWTLRAPTGPVLVRATVSYEVTDVLKSVFQTANLEADIVLRTRTVVSALLEGSGTPLLRASETALGRATVEKLEPELRPLGVTVKEALVESALSRG